MPVFTLMLSTTLRKYVQNYDPHTGMQMEFDLPATVGDIIKHLGIPPHSIHIVMVNNVHGSLDTVVTDKSRVALFPAVGGG